MQIGGFGFRTDVSPSCSAKSWERCWILEGRRYVEVRKSLLSQSLNQGIGSIVHSWSIVAGKAGFGG